jgi:antitoxin Phd
MPSGSPSRWVTPGKNYGSGRTELPWIMPSRTLDAVTEHAYELVHPDADNELDRLAATASEGEVIYLTRAGERIAAVVPADMAAAVEAVIAALEDAADARAAREAMAEIEAGAPTIPLAQLEADLGL